MSCVKLTGAAPHCRAVCNSQSRYSVSGVTPVMPPQPALPFGPVDQLTTPTIAGPPGLSSKTGRAGIAGAGAKPVARALACGIDQTNLQRAGLAGRDQAGDADGAAALAVAADGDADAGDGEAAADGNRNIWHAKQRGRLAVGRLLQLQQRDIGGGAVRQHRIHFEAQDGWRRCGRSAAAGWPEPLSTIRYSAPGCTQCAAVRTIFGAIRLPVQKLPREPTMVTTERATPSVDGAPPPTMACAGAADSSVAAATNGIAYFMAQK